jgi:hypothetical protein
MPALNNLRNLSLDATLSTISTAEGLRSFLSSRPEVIDLRHALDAQAIDSDDVHSFVSELLGHFRRGTRFGEEPVLAAVAVAVETLPAPFAQEFLEDLARVRVAELPLAPRVARLSLRERDKRVSQLTVRDLTIANLVPENWGPPRELRPERVTSGVEYRPFQIVAA